MLGPFGDAVDFIFQERESQAGTVQVGGLREMWDLTLRHLELSFAAILIATLVALQAVTPRGLEPNDSLRSARTIRETSSGSASVRKIAT